jgi:hypothetical protein
VRKVTETGKTGKAMGKLHQCWWRTCREINV